MALFCLLRPRLLDRTLTPDQLTALADLLWLWFHRTAAGPGRCHFGAVVYAFARQRGEAMARSFAARLPTATVDAADPDELRVTGPTADAADPVDPAVWVDVLADPAVADTCVQLRVTFDGTVTGYDGAGGTGTTTFVLCGSPADDGSLLLRAVWRLGRDDRMHQVFRGAAWPEEQPLLAAVDLYLLHRPADPHAAADLALRSFGRANAAHLFVTHRDERRVMRLVRRRTDMPDDRGLAAFARRLGFWSAATAVATAAAVLGRHSPPVAIGGLVGVTSAAPVAAGIAYRHARRAYRYRTRMRQAFDRLYAEPVDVRLADLTGNRSPTLLKFAAELRAAGGRHVCDVITSRAARVSDGLQKYVVGDAVVGLALMNRTETGRVLFPARPILVATTRFADGTRHVTVNHPMYRRQTRPGVTARCLPEEGTAVELLALHRRHVDRRLAGGAVAVPPPSSPAGQVDQVRLDHDVGRLAWRASPYSWADALHASFKVCRGEYLAD